MLSLIRAETSLSVGPVREPLDLDQTKKHLRFSSTSEDSLLDGWISTARDVFEALTGRQLMTAEWEYWLDRFPAQREIELPFAPLQDVISVRYLDEAGAWQTIDADDYRVIAPRGPRCKRGRIVLVSGADWPVAAIGEAASVRILFRAGYGDVPGDVPESIRTALYMLVAHYHKHRAPIATLQGNSQVAEVPMTTRDFILSFKSRPELLPRGICA